MIYLLDTNVLSEGMRQSADQRVARWMVETNEDETFVSAMSIAELHRGVYIMSPGRRREALHLWLRNDLMVRFEKRTIDVNAEIAAVWGVMMAYSRSVGFGLEIMDCFIAATAKTKSMTLVTRNTKDFAHLGIELLNPWQA